jgi:hypothetical protein
MTHPVDIKYVAMRATVDRDNKALNATVDPMLMRDITNEKRHVKTIELTGICSVG